MRFEILKKFFFLPYKGHPSRYIKYCLKSISVKVDFGKNVSYEMVADRKEWKKKTCCADPK